ncbi:hypothetical protein [Rathayibacter soli]|uniref:hypothetical protein n=1 Tax=Rathayibacter soli TaxID=3144168 RepID=UPI0027E41BB0|nr:hypothetical protein [Glaciibacter superstes]
MFRRRWLRPHGVLTFVLIDWKGVARIARVEWVRSHADEQFLLMADGSDVVATGDEQSMGVREFAFDAHGASKTVTVIVARDGHPTPRLRRILLLTDAADSAFP